MVQRGHHMAEIRDWQGKVGQEWARRADALDALIGPVGEAAFATLDGAARVLDVGCGAGASAIKLAARGAQVTALDVSEDLLHVARGRDAEFRVTWALADAATFEAMPRVDGVHSRCGVMFFGDPVGAMGHIRRQVNPGGRLSVITWRDAAQNDWTRLPMEAARPVLGGDLTALPAAGGAGPFGWADERAVRALLEQAGWRDVTFTKVDRPAPITSGDVSDGLEGATQFFMRVGALAAQLRSVDRPMREQVAEAVRRTLVSHRRDDGQVWLNTAAWHITASA